MRDPLSSVDQIISEAQKEGKFEDLQGKGQPLVIDTSPDAVIKGILKEANVSFAPEWIMLAGEIDRLLDQEQQLLQTYAAVAEAEQTALLSGSEAPAAPRTTPGPAARESRRPRWSALVAPLVGKRASSLNEQPRDDRALAEFQRRWDETLERYAALLHDLNRKIRRFNQIVPLVHRQRALLPVRERLDAFTDRFPRLGRVSDGTVHPERGHVPASLLQPPAAEAPLTRKRDVLEVIALQRRRQGSRKPPPIG